MAGESGHIRGVPYHWFGVAEWNGERRMRRRIERGIGLRQATQRARPGMRDRGARLVAWAALLTLAVADNGGGERIGYSVAGRPAGGDRRQHLHRQREQDNR